MGKDGNMQKKIQLQSQLTNANITMGKMAPFKNCRLLVVFMLNNSFNFQLHKKLLKLNLSSKMDILLLRLFVTKKTEIHQP